MFWETKTFILFCLLFSSNFNPIHGERTEDLNSNTLHLFGKILKNVYTTHNKNSPSVPNFDIISSKEYTSIVPKELSQSSEFQEHIQRVYERVTTDPFFVEEALEKAAQFHKKHFKEIFSFVQCAFSSYLEYDNCPYEVLGKEIVKRFLEEELDTELTWHSGTIHLKDNSTNVFPEHLAVLPEETTHTSEHPGHGTRPYFDYSRTESGLVSKYGLNAISCVIRFFFWLSVSRYAWENLWSSAFSKAISQFLISGDGDDSEQESAADAEKWKVITSVYPTPESYLNLFPKDSVQRERALYSVCRKALNSDGVEDNSAMLASCWKQKSATPDTMSSIPEIISFALSGTTLVPAFSILIMLVSKMYQRECPKKDLVDCSNEYRVGSVCVSKCVAEPGYVAFPDPSKLALTFCSKSGKWQNFDSCINTRAAGCYSDPIVGYRLEGLISESSETLGDALDQCDELTRCHGVGIDLNSSRYRLYYKPDPTKNLVQSLVAHQGARFWVKNACPQPFRKYRSLHA